MVKLRWSVKMSKLLYQLPNKSSSVKSGYGWSKWFFLLVLLMAVGILGAELVQPRIWQDYYMRMNYRPDEQIGQLVSKLNFSPRGKEVFFATNPVVSGPEDFNQQCNRHEATVSILGCYDDQNIYIYRVTESKLSGVMETTAAHELLHAAYARLNRPNLRNDWIIIVESIQRQSQMNYIQFWVQNSLSCRPS